MVVTLVTAGGIGGTLAFMVCALAIFMAVMVWAGEAVARPAVRRTRADRSAGDGRRTCSSCCSASALLTEVIGIHALFGAFLAGAIMPPSQELRQQLRERLESLSSVFLLPIFFAYTGLRTEIGLLNDAASWAVCVGIILTAVAGKLLGSMLAARWSGSTWHDAFVLGALMNTRGLMELVALNVGYDLGILSPHMFTMLVVMALVTTAMTGPLIDIASAPDATPRGDAGGEALNASDSEVCSQRQTYRRRHNSTDNAVIHSIKRDIRGPCVAMFLRHVRRMSVDLLIGRGLAFCVHPTAAWRVLSTRGRAFVVAAYAGAAYVAVLGVAACSPRLAPRSSALTARDLVAVDGVAHPPIDPLVHGRLHRAQHGG